MYKTDYKFIKKQILNQAIFYTVTHPKSDQLILKYTKGIKAIFLIFIIYCFENVKKCLK
jgi:hypothetical protein